MVKARKTVVVNFSFISPDRCDKQALCVCVIILHKAV